MTEAEVEAHATYTDGAIDEVYDLARRARRAAGRAVWLASIALLISVGAVVMVAIRGL
jgi:hypothetical protein